jgi:hypothetical protein
MRKTENVTVVITLHRSTVDALSVLVDGGTAEEALRMLAGAAADGVRRPLSWERPWLYQLFGGAFVDKLETNPVFPLNQRPRADRGAP